MKNAKRITLLLFFLFTANNLLSQVDTVWVTKSGKKYHLWGCRYLNETATSLTLQEAIEKGYTPCKVCGAPTGIKENPATPETVTLKQNYPNPFNPVTNIEYSVDKHTFVSMGIFDINGRLIKSLAGREHSPGYYHVQWDGTEQNGMVVADGVYFCGITFNNNTITKKMLLVR